MQNKPMEQPASQLESRVAFRCPVEWKNILWVGQIVGCSSKCLNSQELGPGTRPECWSFVPLWEPLPAFDTMPKPHAPHSHRLEVGGELPDPAPALATSSSPILGSSPMQAQLPTLQTCQISRTFKRIVTYIYMWCDLHPVIIPQVVRCWIRGAKIPQHSFYHKIPHLFNITSTRDTSHCWCIFIKHFCEWGCRDVWFGGGG